MNQILSNNNSQRTIWISNCDTTLESIPFVEEVEPQAVAQPEPEVLPVVHRVRQRLRKLREVKEERARASEERARASKESAQEKEDRMTRKLIVLLYAEWGANKRRGRR